MDHERVIIYSLVCHLHSCIQQN
uniref:Uncharacterized protein n=1 Tax=Arundo donax TaxID=35708 RepID=A0A0A9GXC5_ARUDO